MELNEKQDRGEAEYCGKSSEVGLILALPFISLMIFQLLKPSMPQLLHLQYLITESLWGFAAVCEVLSIVYGPLLFSAVFWNSSLIILAGDMVFPVMFEAIALAEKETTRTKQD